MYSIIETRIISEEKEVTVYGLRHTDGTVIEDVSANKDEVECLAKYYTKMNVSPWNLDEVVPDMIDTPEGLGQKRINEKYVEIDAKI